MAYTMVLLKSILFSLIRLSSKAAGIEVSAIPTAPADKTIPINDSVDPCSRRYKFSRSKYAENVKPIKNDAVRYSQTFLEKRLRLKPYSKRIFLDFSYNHIIDINRKINHFLGYSNRLIRIIAVFAATYEFHRTGQIDYVAAFRPIYEKRTGWKNDFGFSFEQAIDNTGDHCSSCTGSR